MSNRQPQESCRLIDKGSETSARCMEDVDPRTIQFSPITPTCIWLAISGDAFAAAGSATHLVLKIIL